jgi:CHAD domain-containing protein/GNAT superfamily N-acetyltransferase
MLDAYRGTIDSEDEILDDAVDEIDGWLADSPMLEHSLGIEMDGRLVSAVLVSLIDDAPFIGYVITDPAFKGRGLGKASVASALASMAAAGHDRAVLYITEGNVPSERLFATVGAVPEPLPSERRESGSAYQLRLRNDEPITEGIQRIVGSLTDEMMEFLADPSGIGADEAVHQVRRRGKQVRSALRLVEPALGKQRKKLNSVFRDVGRLLADARDARIVVETLDALSIEGLDGVRAILDSLATAEAELVFAGDDAGAVKALALLRKAKRQVSAISVPEEPASVVDGAVSTYAAGRLAYAETFRTRSAEDFHTWRKRVKDHRHHIAFLWECEPFDVADHDRLYELSDALGLAHDLVVLDEHLDRLDLHVPAEVRSAVDDKRIEFEVVAVEVGASLYERSPDEFASLLTDRWTRWRRTAD